MKTERAITDQTEKVQIISRLLRFFSLLRHQETLALLAVAMIFVFMLAATWHRWTRPIIDHGREMHLPERLLSGERLYTDILYYYGPFPPYFNAFLYRVFGIHLSTLHTSGMICAALILLLIYWLARQLMSVREAAITTGVVLLTCAFNVHSGSYIQPYAFAALYGLVFALAALVCSVRFMQCRGSVWLVLAGTSVGMTIISKPELGLLAFAPTALAWALACLADRKLLWRPAALGLLACAAISGITYGWILKQVSWQILVTDNYRLFKEPQLVHFSKHLSGTLKWPQPIWEMIGAAGMWIFLSGLCAVIGLIFSGELRTINRALVLWCSGIVLTGLSLWLLMAEAFHVRVDAGPLKSAPLVLFLMFGVIGRRMWKDGISRLPLETCTLLVLLVFSLLAITRVFFNVSMKSPYTPFTVPALIIIYLYLLFRLTPRWLLPTGRARERARQAAMALIAVTIAVLAVNSAMLARRRYTFEINTPRGQLVVEPVFGRPLADAIRFVNEQSSPGDYLISLPQGTAINFLTDRLYPLREENIVPGFVKGDNEADAIRRLSRYQAPVALLINLPTPEYLEQGFGIDYNKNLLNWITSHYHLRSTFSSTTGDVGQLGRKEFYILAYQLNP
ncbi:MAG: glycosyltransferase family 39 protein [Acidobacteria bacterium]|nr:glycosyltransferase family 39 protein [Acidobacteriota bacterium]